MANFRGTLRRYFSGSSYSALTDHYVNIEYEEDPYNPGYYYYPDYLGYFFSGAGSQPIDWYYVASGIYNSRPDESIHLGDTSASLAEVFLENAKVHEVTGIFGGISVYTQVASLNVGSSTHSVEICDGDDPQLFTITVNFTLPPGGELVPSRCSAKPEQIPDQDYNVGTTTCVMDDSFSRKGHMSISARRRAIDGGDSRPGIRFIVGANKTGQSGTIDTPGKVKVLCSQ